MEVTGKGDPDFESGCIVWVTFRVLSLFQSARFVLMVRRKSLDGQGGLRNLVFFDQTSVRGRSERRQRIRPRSPDGSNMRYTDFEL